jgi:hypothetical protein
MQTYLVKYTTKNYHTIEQTATDEFGAAKGVENNIIGAEVYSVALVLQVNKFRKGE